MIEIRPYLRSDEQAVAGLWQVVFPDEPPWRDPESDIARKLTVQPELFFVAAEEETIVGTAMTGFDGHRGWVYYVAVHPSHRRRGIGRRLMERVERSLAKRGCPKLNLQIRGSDPEALAFYEKLGYRVEDRVSMGKLLQPDGEDAAE